MTRGQDDAQEVAVARLDEDARSDRLARSQRDPQRRAIDRRARLLIEFGLALADPQRRPQDLVTEPRRGDRLPGQILGAQQGARRERDLRDQNLLRWRRISGVDVLRQRAQEDKSCDTDRDQKQHG